METIDSRQKHAAYFFRKYAVVHTILATFCITFLAGSCLAQPQIERVVANNDSLEVFLQNYLKQPNIGTDLSTRYSITGVRLDANKTSEIVVYVNGQWWCGSGGCMALILEPEGTSYRVVNRLTLARLPICVLPTMHNGWHDIAMLVAGGGILHAYWGILKFNGIKYVWSTSRVPSLSGSRLPGGVVRLPLNPVGRLLYKGNSGSSKSAGARTTPRSR